MRKSVVRITGFILILGVVLWKASGILSFKFADGNTILSDFYRLEEDTVDVLTIGSSHAYVNFSPGTLWDAYGIASYNLGASLQPMWNSYYYLKEALKTQKPELIVLEGFGVLFDSDYSDSGRIIKNTAGMKWSLDKLKAIEVSAEDGSELDYLMDYARFHTRYSSLNRGDFFPESEYLDSNDYWHYKDTMGQYLIDKSNSGKKQEADSSGEEGDLREKSEEYYRKTIELARENEIPVVVIVSPYYLYEGTEQRLRKAGEIAAEYGVRFLDTNLLTEEIGLDFSTDYSDNSHMTVEGSRKFSLYIGKYLKENFEISDRRGDEKYGAWDRCAAYTEQYRQNMILKNSSDPDQISALLLNPNYQVFLAVDGNAGAENGTIADFLSKQGVDPASSQVMWMTEGGEVLRDFGFEESEYYISTELHDICVKRSRDGDGWLSQMIVDNKQYREVKNGLNVVVFDTLTDRVADSFGIKANGDGSIVR